MMEAEELSLLTRARSGEREAFREIVVRHQRKVYAVALGIVKDRDLAWDVSQEAMVRVHQHLPEFKGDSSLSTWILRIATHVAIDAVRKERASAKDDIDEVRESDLEGGGEGILSTALGTNPQENALRKEMLSKIQEALGELPEKHRTILVLRELEGLSYEELAERLGIHKGTVMSRLFHARKKMQGLLRRYAGLGPAGAVRGEAAAGSAPGGTGEEDEAAPASALRGLGEEDEEGEP
jgi:RNA polymerase sigma-70 factor (ECF subfamily)